MMEMFLLFCCKVFIELRTSVFTVDSETLN